LTTAIDRLDRESVRVVAARMEISVSVRGDERWRTPVRYFVQPDHYHLRLNESIIRPMPVWRWPALCPAMACNGTETYANGVTGNDLRHHR
ncbi:hypothetical protein, partial [Streptosporangium canum]|uniref:hypothetical protein n=1 Tax=Streptosporangium canum TaxID=324952 RepID=UPI00378E0655